MHARGHGRVNNKKCAGRRGGAVASSWTFGRGIAGRSVVRGLVSRMCHIGSFPPYCLFVLVHERPVSAENKTMLGET